MILVGGMGDMVKVLHADREVSFGNRHPKTSTPKGFEKIIAPYVSVLLFGEYPHDYDRYPYMYIQQVALQSSPIFPGEDQASTIQVCAPT